MNTLSLHHSKTGICPSCGQRTVFHYLGDQRWPPRLAKRKGFFAMSLWNCQNCHTTISEKCS